MNLKKIKIDGIPAILWGEKCERLIIAVHGSHSSKIDDCIWILAEEATKRGYQVLSFDLPQHGERVYETNPCMVEACVGELRRILNYAKKLADKISIFGCSMGAYFSLLSFYEEQIERVWFLSPVTDMERIITNLMKYSGVTEQELEEKGMIENPFETLYWSYYKYVKDHPIHRWNHPTYILRGENDTLSESEYVNRFAKEYRCELTEQKKGEHWFHTEEQLLFFRKWIIDRI